jgi:hypothetical protein
VSKWADKLTAALSGAKDVLFNTAQKLGVKFTPVETAKMIDNITDALELPLAAFIQQAFPKLPPELAKGAAKHALDYIDAAAAGLLAGQK